MFYGWKLATLGSIGNFMLQGGAFYIMNAFMEPLTELHGWSRASISMTMGIASLCGMLSMSGVAYLASKYSLRNIITLSAFIGGVAFVGLGYANELWLYTICFSVVWITAQAFGGVGANILVQKWFMVSRGRAFGLVNVGTSLSGAILPFVALFLVNSIGVKWAYTVLGCMVLICVPFCYRMIRDSPAELGLFVDGVAPSTASGPESSGDSPKSFSTTPTLIELVRNPLIWMLGIAFGVGIMAAAGVLSQLKPRFVDVGFDSYTAMSWMCLAALCAAIGKYLWGWLCDFVSPLKVLKFMLLCNALSLGLSFLPPTTMNVVLFAVAYGTCYGGMWSLLPVIIVYMFGRHNFLLAYRVISFFIVVKSCGYPIVGLSYDLTGNYDMAYGVFIAALFFVFLWSLTAKETQSVEYMEKQGMRPL